MSIPCTTPCDCDDCKERGVSRYTWRTADGRLVLEVSASCAVLAREDEHEQHQTWSVANSIALDADELRWLVSCLEHSKGHAP